MIDVTILHSKRTSHDKKMRRLKIRSNGETGTCNITINNQDDATFSKHDESALTMTLCLKDLELIRSGIDYIIEDTKQQNISKENKS